MVKFSWGENEENARKVLLPMEDINKVKMVVAHNPIKYADGTHFVRIAIDRLYNEEKRLYEERMVEEKKQQPDPSSSPMFFSPNTGGWK
jgi:hypothetical protein